MTISTTTFIFGIPINNKCRCRTRQTICLRSIDSNGRVSFAAEMPFLFSASRALREFNFLCRVGFGSGVAKNAGVEIGITKYTVIKSVYHMMTLLLPLTLAFKKLPLAAGRWRYYITKKKITTIKIKKKLLMKKTKHNFYCDVV
jgi:hypothetical protein